MVKCDLWSTTLELQKKHTIEVIDRFRFIDLAQRLAESFETALELSGGTAVISDMDDSNAMILFFLQTLLARFVVTAWALRASFILL